MIERMRKLNLIALSYERDRTLDVLERTGAAEIKLRAEEEGTRPCKRRAASLPRASQAGRKRSTCSRARR